MCFSLGKPCDGNVPVGRVTLAFPAEGIKQFTYRVNWNWYLTQRTVTPGVTVRTWCYLVLCRIVVGCR